MDEEYVEPDYTRYGKFLGHIQFRYPWHNQYPDSDDLEWIDELINGPILSPDKLKAAPVSFFDEKHHVKIGIRKAKFRYKTKRVLKLRAEIAEQKKQARAREKRLQKELDRIARDHVTELLVKKIAAQELDPFERLREAIRRLDGNPPDQAKYPL